MNEEKSKAYESLSPQRKQLVDTVLSNLEKGTGIWEQGWVIPKVPESAITGKRYRGVNNFFLSLISMSQGYSDNRWMTFSQMEEKGWRFKTDEEGNSIAKGKGATIEYFEFRDKLTKQPFTKSTIDGMSEDEKNDYWEENVIPMRKYYKVFNGDLIDGIPKREVKEINPNDISLRAESIISYWNENESKIVYGGHEAFYRPTTDEIQLPEKQEFHSLQEFYGTALHEIGHSTGHETRLNRDIKNSFGSSEYAQEELRAEIASMFISQDLEIPLTDSHIQNNSAYINSWHSAIKENPNSLFTAIADADKISKFVMSKEMGFTKNTYDDENLEVALVKDKEKPKDFDLTLTNEKEMPEDFDLSSSMEMEYFQSEREHIEQPETVKDKGLENEKHSEQDEAVTDKNPAKDQSKDIEHYAIVQDQNIYGETVYKVYTASEYGQTSLAINYAFSDKEALDKEFKKMQGLPFWKDKEFTEVTFEELENISLAKAKEKDIKESETVNDAPKPNTHETIRVKNNSEVGAMNDTVTANVNTSATKIETLSGNKIDGNLVGYSESMKDIKEEKSQVFFPPSEIAAKAMNKTYLIDMSQRGIESLTRMGDKEVIEKASNTKNGAKFTQLYNGISILGNENKDERSLMTRLAMFCNEDKEQLLRVFKSSGQFREEKPNSFYDIMADQSIQFISQIKTKSSMSNKPLQANETKGHVGANAKT